jgi:hypothetical protein
MDLLDCAWASRLSASSRTATTADLRKDFWSNCGQSHARKPFGGTGAFTPKSIWYSFQCDLALDAIDACRLHGLPSDLVLNGIANHELYDLAGECYSLPIITMISTIFYYQPYGSWWKAPA